MTARGLSVSPDPYARRLARAHKDCRLEIAEIARSGYPSPADRFGEIESALLIQSDEDPQRRATELNLAERLQNGRLVHVPDAGHAVFADRYDAAYAELRTFLLRL